MVSLPLPTSSISGSFQWPGPANLPRPAWLRPMTIMRSKVALMSPVVRQEFAPTSGPQSQTASKPYWQRL